MSNEPIVEALIEGVGGESNIVSFEHCATRLRIILKDNSKVNKEKSEMIEGVKGYFYSTGQHQFIFGTGKVNQVFEAFEKRMGKNKVSGTSFKEDVYAQMNPLQRVIRTLADILLPLIPALVTTGLLMGIRGLLIELGLQMDATSLALFGMLTDTAFAFLPVLITYSAVKRFGGNPILGIVLGLMLVSPVLPNAWNVAAGTAQALEFHFFGFTIGLVGYQGTVLPGILAGWMIVKIEKWARTWVPQMMDLVITPFLALIVPLALMLFVLGPISQSIEHGVTDLVVLLINAPFGIGYIIFAGLQQLLTVTGLHHSLSIIEIDLLARHGTNVLNPLITAGMAGQLGAGVALAFMMKNRIKRSNALSAASSTLFGITEPLLFGVTLPIFPVFVSGMIAGGVGGLLTYIMGLEATGMGITFIPGLLLYSSNWVNLIKYIILIAVVFTVGFGLVTLQRKRVRTMMLND